MPGGLLTDQYELNMAASYLARDMDGLATFSLFVRKLPARRGFLVAAGLEDALAFLERFSFDDDELDYLREGIGYGTGMVEAFRGLRFTGDVWAVPEGRVVLADEPLLEVTAPIAEAQLVETYLLNQLTYQTAVATKAARCRLAAGAATVVDFAFRRTHGEDAAMAVARVSAIAGFGGTSNVEAARRYGLRPVGTMAHSFVEAFEDEADAFRAFAQDHPDRTTFLVDTYDTLEGVRVAIAVIRELDLTGPLAVRLDSGDLAVLARDARGILDAAGLEHVQIFASGGLDEHEIDDIVRAGAPVDGFGVGTRMGTSSDAPSLDSAYKLVSYDGRPVMKLSEGKRTHPGAKQVFRRVTDAGVHDLLALREEAGPPGSEPLLVPVMAGGRRLGRPDTLEAARARCAADLAALPPAARELREPRAPAAEVSPVLVALGAEVAARHRRPPA
ncbi:MAG: nicotinate phosphoribosyltransferase [Acidimicrobiia bacterium]|nr:nicotinate phosphoribosyltransferase [Acidimicrobiia bacterium]